MHINAHACAIYSAEHPLILLCGAVVAVFCPVWVVLKGKDAEMICLSRHAGTSDCFHCLNILITLQSSGSARREVNYSAELVLCWRKTAAMRQRTRCQPECHSWRFFSAKTGCTNEQSYKLIDGVNFFSWKQITVKTFNGRGQGAFNRFWPSVFQVQRHTRDAQNNSKKVIL